MRPFRPLAAALVAACWACAPGSHPSYIPRSRDVTITAVPLLTKELGSVYPFLARDFAPGGVLAGREVYAFVPGTVTVVEGDTVHFRFVNPEDDAHDFVLGELEVGLPGQSETRATWIARRAGIYTFTCTIAAHQPAMWGQIVVLAPGAVGSDAGGSRARAADADSGPPAR